ncbi:hypothetical protein [Streptomyces sp. NPDC088812]|uniref:hypothetical protein n=1 Tax=Streptomyces sp. NPDC088812 TaxID=3365905 RepID=UPI0038266A7C
MQTLAALTGGAVSVEDPAHRVLAYSRSDGQVDEVRRLSILGQSCPPSYLEVLHEAGVYQRLRTEEVVEVGARPDLGTRRRLAAGITAGGRLLGTIWVQEAGAPLTEGALQALRGAARLAAPMLIRQPGGAGSDGGVRQELAAGLLAGRLLATSLAGHLGIAARTCATAIAVELNEPAGDGGPEAELRRTRAVDTIALHAAAHRRTAVATRLDGRLYVLVPDAAPHPADAPAPAGRATPAGWTTDLVTTLRRHLGTPVQAAVSPPRRLADAPAARAEADRILDVVAHDPGREVATYQDARTRP